MERNRAPGDIDSVYRGQSSKMVIRKQAIGLEKGKKHRERRGEVQSWPNVLRMTQILISTKFSASVSLDIFYQMLLWNTKV
jgi:hypothetical protein